MVIDSGDIRWNQYIERLPSKKQDIYFTEQYCRLCQQIEGGQAQLFVYEEGDNFLLYPYIRRMVPSAGLDKVYYDIQTPYGYGGPIVRYEDTGFIKTSELAFMEYCKNGNVIAEFIRFHPFLENERIFRQDIEVLHNRYTVWLNLEQDLDEIWMHEFSATCRNRTRKCKKNGLVVEVSEDYAEFMDIYGQTMSKVGAEDFYYFNEAYYKEISSDSSSVLMRVRKDKETLAAAIFMVYKDYFHYHLGGSRREYLQFAPNNILMWNAIQYAKAHGCKKMHFGGGLTDSKEDTLFRFKSTFSSSCADFYIGKRVHNDSIYQELIRRWEEVHGRKAKILLQYHEDNA